MPAPSPLSSLIDATERSGKLNLWTQDIARDLPDISAEALRQALRRQQSKGRIAQASRGSKHWVIIPLQDATAGAPPLESWLHAYLNKTLGIPYYVGLLSAAETYGASPYATMVTQIVTLKPRRPLRVGRHQLVFLGRKNVELMPARWHETPDGHFKVSTPELTALELVYRQQLVGGASRVLSVLQAMANMLSETALLEALDRMNEVPASQRLGVLLSMAEQPQLASLIQNWLANKRTRNIPLSSGQAPDEPSQLDPRFKILVPLNFQLANS
jgi:predicted transcriptional regulator of viral defense system